MLSCFQIDRTQPNAQLGKGPPEKLETEATSDGKRRRPNATRAISAAANRELGGLGRH